MADKSEQAGYSFRVAEAYLRAATYCRAAASSLQSNRPLRQGAGRARDSEFLQVIPLLGIPARPVKFPYEKTTLPGSSLAPVSAVEKLPSLLSTRAGTPRRKTGLP